jgi:hypothetical protein
MMVNKGETPVVLLVSALLDLSRPGMFQTGTPMLSLTTDCAVKVITRRLGECPI